MKAKSTGLKIIYAAFLVIICASWILWLFVSPFVDTRNSENREPHEMPEVKSIEDYERFPAEMEGFLNDRIPLRNYLVTMNSALDYYLFGSVRSERAFAGKNGWVFYSDSADGNPIACYQGTNLMTQEELERLAENCVRQRDYLAERGIEFVIFIAPNKERVYPEYMPDRYGQPAEMYRALQAINYLRENTDLRIVYPYEELMAAKEVLSEELYYPRDTHWNQIGGYIGSRALLKELGISLPDISEMKISYAGEKTGDLAKAIGLGMVLKSADYLVEGYDTHDAVCVGEFDDIYEYKAEGADPRKLYGLRDSFFVNMVPYMHSQFNESHTKFFKFYIYEDFESQHPDIFVYECVERYMDRLLTFSVEYGK